MSIQKPKNVFWVDTFLIDLPYDVSSKDTNACLISEEYDLSMLKHKVCFELTKLNDDNNIEVSCVRCPSSKNSAPCDGYKLQFHFTVIGIEEAAKSVDMFSHEDRVSVRYIFKEENAGFISCNLQLKIVVRMIEFENLPNELRENCEMFRDLMPEVYESEEKQEELAFLLRRPKLSDVFTGRNNGLLTTIRMTYISRTARYSKELAEYLRARRRHEPLPMLNFGEILNWIVCCKHGPIKPQYIVVAFLKSYKLGLNFLKLIATDCIHDILNENQDLDLVIDIIQAADLVDDSDLFDRVFSIFIGKCEAIIQSDKWKQVEEEANSLACSIIHGLNIRLKSRGNKGLIDPDLYAKTNHFQKRDASHILPLYQETMILADSDVVLDIGCGTGDVTKNILATALEKFELLLGVDRYTDMVTYANDKNSSNNVRYKVLDIAGDVFNFKEEWGPFSKIYSFYCLHWIKDLKKALLNISILMDENGKCLLVFVAKCPVFTMYEKMAEIPQWRPYMLDVNEFVPDTHHSDDPSAMFAQMMQDVGFKYIDCESLEKSFAFTSEQLKACVVGINPFTKRIPESQRDEYIKACIDTLLEINLESGRAEANKLHSFSYELLVAHGSAD